MTDDWSDESTKKIVQIWNERGHAGAAAHDDNVLPGSKAMVEASWALEWAQAAEAQLGLAIADVAMNPSDPPDAFATIAGRQTRVELVEFVDGALLARIKADRRAQGEQVASVTSHDDPFFAAAQWSEDRFLAHLEELIDRKNSRYRERGISIDYLVIYSAETWLVSQQVHRRLARASIERRSNLAQVHFLMDHEPGRPGRYPLFRVY